MKEKKTVLVIEDEQSLAEAIRMKLSNSGCEVLTARAVPEALDHLKNGQDIDAVWLDHYLIGREDGLDLVARLKSAESEWKETPVFVVSNTASADKVHAYMRLGVEKYYVKAEHRLEDIITDIKEVIG